MPEDEDEAKHNVQVIVNSLSNERRTVVFNDVSEDEIKGILRTIESSFLTLRASDCLLLTGSDGQIVIINLNNVVFIEVRVG